MLDGMAGKLRLRSGVSNTGRLLEVMGDRTAGSNEEEECWKR